MKTNIKILIVISLFTLYWISTIFFTIPENYLQIKSTKAEKIFSSFFYQKWSFFAPPPQHNERLYFEFVKINSDTVTVEVLEELNLMRRARYLRNDELSVIDYILSNSISNITDIIKEEFDNYNFKNCKEVGSDKCFEDFMSNFGDDLHRLNEIQTLKNYGVQVLSQEGNAHEFEKFRVITTNIPINSFSKRYDDIKEDEDFSFSTRFYNLKKLEWEK